MDLPKVFNLKFKNAGNLTALPIIFKTVTHQFVIVRFIIFKYRLINIPGGFGSWLLTRESRDWSWNALHVLNGCFVECHMGLPHMYHILLIDANILIWFSGRWNVYFLKGMMLLSCNHDLAFTREIILFMARLHHPYQLKYASSLVVH